MLQGKVPYGTADVVLLNIGEDPTFNKGEKSSIIDIMFISIGLKIGNNTWEMADVYYYSGFGMVLWDGVYPSKKSRET